MPNASGSDERSVPVPVGSGLSGLLLAAGRAFLERKEWPRARASAEQVLALPDAQLSDGEREAASSLLARSLDQLGHRTDAEAVWRTVLALREKAGDTDGMARVWIDIGMLRKRDDRLADARAAFSESLRSSAPSTPGRERAMALEELGVVERLLGETVSSLRHLEEALRIYEALSVPEDTIRALEKLANVKQRLGRLGEAEEDYLRVLAMLQERQDPGMLAIVYNNLGGIRHSLGDHEGAIERFQTAHRLFVELGEQLQVAVTLSNLGLLRSLRGENASAKQHLEESLAILESLDERRRRAGVLNNLSLVAYTSGRYSDALRWADASLAARDESGSQGALAKPYINRARALLALSRVEDASVSVARAAELAEKVGSSEDRAEAALVRTALLLAREHLDESLESVSLATTIAGDGLPRQRAEALRLEARIRSRRGEDGLARDRLLESETLFDRLADPFHRALCGADLGRVFLRAKSYEAAATRLRIAADLFARLENAPLQFETLLGLAEAERFIDSVQSEAHLDEAADLARAGDHAEWIEEVEKTRARLRTFRSDGTTDLAWLRLLAIVAAQVRRSVASRLPLFESEPDGLPGWLLRELGLVWTSLEDEAGRPLVHPHRAGSPEWAPAWERARKELDLTPDTRVHPTQSEGRLFAVIQLPSLRGARWVAGGGPVAAWTAEPDSGAVRVLAELIGLWLESFAVPESAGTTEVVREFEGMVFSSLAMSRIASVIEQVATSDAAVLIRGESGTGKELVARALHARSGRSGGFVAINCPSVPRELIESELFGSEKGAYTGADRTRVGQIELANGGTLFLDEIGDMEMSVQTKLLRFLEERELFRVGGRQAIPVDVRLVAATSRDLDAMVEAGTFRADLLHRVMVVPIFVPALRDRPEDIPVLVQRFAAERSEREGKMRRFEADAIAALSAQPWKGNVRELRNVVHRVFALSNAEKLTMAAIPTEYRQPPIERATGRARSGTAGSGIAERTQGFAVEVGHLRPGETLSGRLMEIEGTLVRRALEQEGWNQSQSARRLGIKESTLRDKIRKFGIRRPERGRSR